jgi:hypothetical protein
MLGTGIWPGSTAVWVAALAAPVAPGEAVLTITTTKSVSVPFAVAITFVAEPSEAMKPPPHVISTKLPRGVTLNTGFGPTPGASIVKVYTPADERLQ